VPSSTEFKNTIFPRRNAIDFRGLAVANRMAYNNRFQIYIRFARIFTEVLI